MCVKQVRTGKGTGKHREACVADTVNGVTAAHLQKHRHAVKVLPTHPGCGCASCGRQRSGGATNARAVTGVGPGPSSAGAAAVLLFAVAGSQPYGTHVTSVGLHVMDTRRRCSRVKGLSPAVALASLHQVCLHTTWTHASSPLHHPHSTLHTPPTYHASCTTSRRRVIPSRGSRCSTPCTACSPGSDPKSRVGARLARPPGRLKTRR